MKKPADCRGRRLAAAVKTWRGKMPARQAADILGISRRTLEGIEQGRPFRYETLLLCALKVLRIEQTNSVGPTQGILSVLGSQSAADSKTLAGERTLFAQKLTTYA